MERFSMRDWQPVSVFDKKLRIEEEINSIEEKRQPLIQRKKEIELALSELNNRVRRGTFSREEYAKMCDDQDDLKSEKQQIEKALLIYKEESRKKHLEKERVNVEAKKNNNGGIKDELISLRDKYMAFSADTTRVSSMRAMSSKFVEEITYLLKFTD